MDSLDREELLANLKPGGKYEHIVAIYRTYDSSKVVGDFDRTLIEALPPNVRWIAHNGAGYDQVDVKACREKGTSRPFLSFRAPRPPCIAE
jgi:glyoxylate reductase